MSLGAVSRKSSGEIQAASFSEKVRQPTKAVGVTRLSQNRAHEHLNGPDVLGQRRNVVARRLGQAQLPPQHVL